MGDVIADAQLAATDGPPPEGSAVVAFMNPGGVRGRAHVPGERGG